MHSTLRHNLSAIPRSIRIIGRRVANWWKADVPVPSWLQDWLIACALFFPVWLLLALTLLVF